jgi:hypothetical protein
LLLEYLLWKGRERPSGERYASRRISRQCSVTESNGR